MLEGIHILNEIEKCTASSAQVIFGIIVGAASLLALYVIIVLIRDGDLPVIPIIMFLMFGVMSFGYFSDYINRVEYKEYKVTIDDNVSLKEFNERYEIIDREGEIYTIVEKSKE